MSRLPTAEEFLKNKSDSFDTQMRRNTYYKDNVECLCIEFAKLHVQAALKAASESRCINMYDKTWFAQSLEPGTKILDTVNITVDKDSILNAYPLEKIK
jgi:hypothetical protein